MSVKGALSKEFSTAGQLGTVTSSQSQEIIFQMPGKLEYENNIPLRNHLLSIAKNNPHFTMVLDFQEMDFVGSSGISILVETLKLLQKEPIKLKVANIRPEFLKVFRLYHFPDQELAVEKWGAGTRTPVAEKTPFPKTGTLKY